MEHLVLGLAAVVVLGIGAQWISWRLRQPSILLLLVCGFVAGPVTGWLDPDALLGDLLAFPSISADSNLDIIVFLAERLEEAGARAEVLKDASGAKANLFATIGPEADGGIVSLTDVQHILWVARPDSDLAVVVDRDTTCG